MTGRRAIFGRRRNHLSSTERKVVWALAAVSGVVAMTAGCHPVGTPVLDPLLTALFAATVTWAAATAPWWALATSSAGLAMADPHGWRLVLMLGAFVTMLVLGSRRAAWAIPRAVVGAACAQVALRLEIDAPFGRSALVAALTLGLIIASGLSRKPRAIRRRVLYALAGIGIGVAIASIGAAAGALTARSNLEKGVEAAQDGLTALRAGEPELASQRFSEAADYLGDARGAVQGPWMWPARAVPVLSQHVEAGSSLVDAARSAADTVAGAASGIDLDSVRLRGGYIDLTALADLEVPLRDSASAVRHLDATVRDARSGWLIGPVDSRLSDLEDETESAVEQATNALEVTSLAPRLLGADGKRVWFVMFTTPSEARGLGGFPGNFAEITTDGGFITVTRFGRAVDLIGGGPDPDARIITGPADYLARYGPAGAGEQGAPAERLFWNNVTLSPDLPSVAQVVDELYQQSGGQKIDGVIVADPIALEGIVGLTGPLQVDGTDVVLDASNTAEFLLRGQYEAFPAASTERKDALESVAAQATQALLLGDLPSPAIIARELGEPARTGHLIVWSLHDEDQEPLRRLGVSGAMPEPTVDGIAYTINNSGPNKLDAFLTREMTYEATVDEDSGDLGATLTITLGNTLPTPITLSPDLTGNLRDLPAGTNRSWLAVYSPLTIIAAEVDGVPRALAAQPELGWNAYSTYLNVAPGSKVTLTVHLAGRVDTTHGYSLTVRPQPLGHDNNVLLTVSDVHGARLIDYKRPLNVVTTLYPSA